MRFLARQVSVLVSVLLVGVCAHANEFTIELTVDGQRVEGTPLAWSGSDVFLLARDGHLWNFAPDQAANYRRTSGEFRGLSAADMRGQLKREFGAAFDVSGTGHYLVVHPSGERNLWAPRFEELYRSFCHYFAARGWRPEEPRFPLVAIVFPDAERFRQYSVRIGQPLTGNTLGYYSLTTNRILLYDATERSHGGNDWHVNAETIIHEAAHQAAFNTGIHNRFAVTPRWVAEGLGTMFEARGVWDSRSYRRLEHRINREQLANFRKYVGVDQRGHLAKFVSTDEPFLQDTIPAYAQAWALTFFLVETMPRQYLQYLRRTAAQDPFSTYSATDRLNDFREIFGENLPVLESHFVRYVRGL
jgi:hypothetical protein